MKSIFGILICTILMISCGPSKQGSPTEDKRKLDSVNALLEKSKKEAEELRIQQEFENSPERLREKLQQNENQNFRKFIKIDWEIINPLFGRKFVKGTITSRASAATYKDIVVKIQYLSKTSSVIRSWETTIYEFLAPKRSIPFQIDLFNYGDEVKRINVFIKDVEIE